jgi:hypothetical protein
MKTISTKAVGLKDAKAATDACEAAFVAGKSPGGLRTI